MLRSLRRRGVPAGPRFIRILAIGLAAVLAAVLAAAVAGPASASARPNLRLGSAYLVAPGNLRDGHYYQSFPGYADFGLTIGGALALAATGDQNPVLKGIAGFLDSAGKDPHGNTVNTWTGIGTRFASGGSIGDELLLAEVTGYDPHHFGGHNLITALNASVCAHASAGHNTSCAGAGNYSYATSVFDQALGIIAQLRAGQRGAAAAPVRYLESLRNGDGSFPSLIPDSHDQDVDSTAMAAMALTLVPGAAAAADVRSGLAWIAGQQDSTGGFPGASGDSVNSAGLAIQALTLRAARYRPQISAALGFLAREQNSNGGFAADAGQHGSNLRASTQAVGGAAGTPFGTLHRSLRGTAPPPPPPHTGAPGPNRRSRPRPTATVTQTVTATAAASTTAAASSAAAAGPRRSATPSAAPDPAPQPLATAATAAPGAFATTTAVHGSALATALWWTVLGVGVAAAAAIGLLYLRRRRRYPAARSQA
jgi:Prenyltransferase and squalene oxidase repeat